MKPYKPRSSVAVGVGTKENPSLLKAISKGSKFAALSPVMVTAVG
jgi:hypothetical protein